MIDGARNVLRGLIASRLWPIAVALIVALVALPVVLRGGGSGSAGAGLPPLVTTTTTPAAGTATAPAAAGSTAGAGSGQGRDPFRGAGGGGGGLAGDASAAPDGEQAQPASPASDAIPAKPDAGTGDTATAQGPATATTKAKAKAKAETAVQKTKLLALRGGLVSLRFGTTGDRPAKRLRSALSLPSPANPLVVLSAIRSDGVTTRARMSSAVTATGNGICRPSPARCRSIDLRAGDTQFLDFPGKPLYRLDVLSVGGRVAPVSALSRAGAARATFAAKVRFGATGVVRTRRLDAMETVAAGSAVAFEYLGVGADRRSGVFLLGPNAGLRSPNACLDGVACRVISLHPGGRAIVAVSSASGPRRYELRFVSLRPRFSATPALARLSRARAAGAGRAAHRTLLDDPRTAKAVGALSFSSADGTVSRRVGAARP